MDCLHGPNQLHSWLRADITLVHTKYEIIDSQGVLVLADDFYGQHIICCQTKG
jgi:hypothetical protein